jgi:peptidyl-tRNA hydrolase
MKIKVIYRKNLKMSTGKIAAQVAHAVMGLEIIDHECTIIVLKASDKRFFDTIKNFNENKNDSTFYIHRDFGLTEVAPYTETCFAWVDSE